MSKEFTSPIDRRRNGSALWRFVPVLLVLAGLCLAYLMGWHHYLTLAHLADSRVALKVTVADNPYLAPICFSALYILAVALSFPSASILTIVSGFLFGWLLGAAVALVSATTGAALLFLAARSAFGPIVTRRTGSFAARFAEGFRKGAFAYLLVLRIAPLVPFVVVNIVPALFNVRLRTFIAATAIGRIPAAFAYAWLGEGIGSMLVAAQASGKELEISDLVTPQITLAFVALALVAALAVVVKKIWSARSTG